jgi:hypothetical protein
MLYFMILIPTFRFLFAHIESNRLAQFADIRSESVLNFSQPYDYYYAPDSIPPPNNYRKPIIGGGGQGGGDGTTVSCRSMLSRQAFMPILAELSEKIINRKIGKA